MTVKRTRLCYWIARPANLSHTYCVRTELRWLLSKEFNTKNLLVVTYYNLFHCVAESWWNMPFKGMGHGNGVAGGAVAKLLRFWHHASALWRHAVWIRIVTSLNARMGYEYPLLKHGFINMIRTPSKQWGMCDKSKQEQWHPYMLIGVLTYLYTTFFKEIKDAATTREVCIISSI